MRASIAWPCDVICSCASGDHLRHRVLDLQPGIHLHEVERRVGISRIGDDEFDRAGTGVADRLGRSHRRRAHPGTALRRHARRRRFLEHLLVAALHRAIALKQVHALSVRIGKDLELDVPRVGQVLLEQHALVTEGRLRFTPGRGERGGEPVAALDDAHALAAAAGRSLDEHRITHRVGLRQQRAVVLRAAVVARNDGYAGLPHERLAFRLRPHGADRGRRRTDKGEAGGSDRCGEVRVFRQEAVAGMDGLRPGCLGDGDDPPGVKVARARRRGTEPIALVAGRDVQRIRIGIRIHRDGADAQAPRGARDAASDLAAVGDQDLVEHHSPGRDCGVAPGLARPNQRAIRPPKSRRKRHSLGSSQAESPSSTPSRTSRATGCASAR
jgi:hypothetical protein